MNLLPSNKQAYFKEVLYSQRITLNSEIQERTAVRKIVKAKNKKAINLNNISKPQN